MELCSMSGLKGKVTIPGDKSISHRCVMFGSIANGYNGNSQLSLRCGLSCYHPLFFNPLELRLKQISPSQK